MKMFSILFFFISFQALAFDICQFPDTYEFSDKFEKSITLKNEGPTFAALERKMIYDFLKKDAWNEAKDENQAVRIFLDYSDNGNEPGYNAGEIVYYKIENKMIAKVHFFPGDNEYGAFYEIQGGKAKELALIGDGEINCL